jgi:poly(A) polymerase
MNALFLSRDGTIHDFVNGRADLEARRVRFIGDPAQRIAEDYLRILRFFRFHAAYGEGPLDHAGLHACVAARGGLETLSRERVRMELLKLLAARNAAPTLALMSETGLLEQVIGGVPLLASVRKMIDLESSLSLEPDPVRRLGALAVLVTEDAARLRERLRLANMEFERLAGMAEAWRHFVSPANDHAARVLLYRRGRQTYSDSVLLAWSRAPQGVADESWRALAALPAQWQAPVFPLKAADFLARGVAKGPALGAALRAAEEAWIAQDFPSDVKLLAGIADAAARESKKEIWEEINRFREKIGPVSSDSTKDIREWRDNDEPDR